jgi:nucleotide sugar dehydrogenase
MPLKICVLGAGRVGSVVAAAFLRSGANVYISDIDSGKIERIKSGKPILEDEPSIDVTFRTSREKSLFPTSNPRDAIAEADTVVVAVPVGLKNGKPDFSSLTLAADDIAASLVKGSLVVLETSVPPGTTRKILGRRIEVNSKLEVGRDFFLGYSPERISEGTALSDLELKYPKIVSGIDTESLQRVSSLYSSVAKKGVIRMSSVEAAEAEKLFEGIYRDVNIALANQLALFCEKAGLDYWEIMNAANSQPYCHLHRPGSGVGGACIPVYPVFISNMADEMGINLSVVKEAREENELQPIEVAESAIKFSSAKKGDKIAILGLAFRGDVSDDRLSPTYPIASYLREKEFNVWVHDPICKPSKASNDFAFTSNLKEAIDGAKLLLISTDHSEYKNLNIEEILSNNPSTFIYDARGVLRSKKNKRIHIIGSSSKNSDN